MTQVAREIEGQKANERVNPKYTIALRAKTLEASAAKLLNISKTLESPRANQQMPSFKFDGADHVKVLLR